MAEYTPTDHTALNKPIAVSGNKPDSAKSYFYYKNDNSDGQVYYRPYQSQAEVLTTIPQSARNSSFLVVINSTGTLNSDGSFTGGTNDLYYFVDISTLKEVGSDVDLSDYYTRTEIDNKWATVHEKTITFTATSTVAPDITLDYRDDSTIIAFLNSDRLLPSQLTLSSDNLTVTPNVSVISGGEYTFYISYITNTQLSASYATPSDAQTIAQSLIDTAIGTTIAPLISYDGELKVPEQYLPDATTADWVDGSVDIVATSTTQLVFTIPSEATSNTLILSLGIVSLSSSTYEISGTTITVTGGFTYTIGVTYTINYKYLKAS